MGRIVSLGDDGIVYIVYTKEMDAEDVKTYIEELNDIVSKLERKALVVTDATRYEKLFNTDSAMAVARGISQLGPFIERSALVVKSVGQSIVSKVVINLSGRTDVKVFYNMSDAIQWVKCGKIDNLSDLSLIEKSENMPIENITLIEQNFEVLVEKERLDFLTQIIGGIAHNLRTPLVSSSGGVVLLRNSTQEIGNIFKKLGVYEDEQNKKMISEMLVWEDTIQDNLKYMSDVITAVKEQITGVNSTTNTSFTLSELVDRIFLLMGFELKKNKIQVNKIYNVDIDIKISGNLSSLIQVFSNLISNSIDSYKGNEGNIDFIIQKNERYIIISVVDSGIGMPSCICNKIFKEMVTTKGKDGTGLGLLISNSIIKAEFKGFIDFNSIEGKGTAFSVYISY